MAVIRINATTGAGIAVISLTMASLSAQAALDSWHIEGTNRAQVEYYRDSGNEAASPYPFEGRQAFDELNLSLNRRLSPYERINLSLSALINDSDYRSPEQGGNLERARLFWEKGDGELPIRLEGGDFYAYQSVRTLQSSLKGAQVEFQPRLGTLNHSIQVFAGQQAPTYRDFKDDQPVFAGASWLMESDIFGALVINASHAEQDPDNGPEREQQLGSVAYELPFSGLGQSWRLEAEAAWLEGERGDDEERDPGYFAELSGNSESLPLNYRISYARYGRDYQPLGGAVTPDQRAIEGHATWRFESGRFLRGRYLDYRDDRESDNPIDTHTTGLTYGGELLDWRGYQVHGNLDAFVTERKDDDGTVDSRDATLNASFNLPVTEAVSTRLGLLGQKRKNQISPRTTTYLRQTSVALDYRFNAWGINGTVSPGLLYRELDGDNRDSRELNPTLNASLSQGSHTLRLAYSSLDQDNRQPSRLEVLTQRATLRYGYQHKQHRFGVEAQYYDRDPESQEDTHAYRTALFWEYHFSKPAQVAPTDRLVMPSPKRTLSVTGFDPGTPRLDVTDALSTERLGKPRKDGDLLVYEAPVFQDIQRRQRLVYQFRADMLRSTSLIIDFDAIGDERTTQRIFSEVLGNLIQRFGPPERQVEEGDFSPDLAERLATGGFARTYQWRLNGRLLRFGIPSRVDGQVRMELRYARSLPPVEHNDWGITELP